MTMEDKHAQTYLEEARELLAELEEAVLELENNMSDMELVNRIFRAMHTIKGSGAMFGFDAVAGFTHHVETVLDQVRNGVIPVTNDLAGLILAARDEISSMLFGASEADSAGREEIIAALRSLLPGEKNEGGVAGAETKEAVPDSGAEVQPVSSRGMRATYRIRFIPGSDTLRYGNDPIALLNEMDNLGELRVTALADRIPCLEEINYDDCYLGWDMTLISEADINAIRDVFIFVEDSSEVAIEKIANETTIGDAVTEKVGEILVARGDVPAEAVERAAKDQKKIGEILIEAGTVSKEKVNSALVEQHIIRQQAERHSATSIRVAAEKLDQLINIVGELVTTQAQLTQAAGSNGNSELLTAVEGIERLTGELRDCVLGVRMLPIGSTFAKFKRLVRDLSAGLGKEVDFITEGDETELDKTVIEKIGDPLVHLIRNSLDHGIETPEKRETSGKPRRGIIRLTAAHAGGEVIIAVEDDGKGLDTEAIVRKAMEKGLIDDAKSLSDSQIFNLIFQPGFSTAEVVTDVSGRGVGMDVVRREIEALRGSFDIQSKKGKGTTVTVRLPLTLAIIDGLLVESGRERFVIPLHHVQECVELTGRDINNTHGRHVMNVRDRLVPYVRLSEFFVTSDREALSIEQVIVVQAEDFTTGLVVDRIVGEKQAVIKPLGKMFRQADGVSGATILGDGTVALILDVPQITRCAQREEAA